MNGIRAQARRALLAAAEYLEEHGWRQPDGDGGNGACAWIALGRVEGRPRVRHDAERLLRAHIGERSIMVWNDEPGRTREQVVAAMREAASS